MSDVLFVHLQSFFIHCLCLAMLLCGDFIVQVCCTCSTSTKRSCSIDAYALCVQELLRDPVVAADGHTYERQHIAEWLAKSDTSPMTNERMDHKHLIPNIVLRQVMDAYFAHGTEVVQ